jgi:hypothetical protein
MSAPGCGFFPRRVSWFRNHAARSDREGYDPMKVRSGQVWDTVKNNYHRQSRWYEEGPLKGPLLEVTSSGPRPPGDYLTDRRVD